MNKNDETIETMRISAEKLASLLKEPETGSVAWWICLKERLDEIRALGREFGITPKTKDFFDNDL